EEISGATSLADILKQRPATEDEWRRIGRTIRAFHEHHVLHQDLNAMNILLGENRCHLIDFDRGQIFMGDSWHTWVLARLLRSLNKLSGLHDPFYFSECDWEYLVNGYAENKQAKPV
ncbi:MAG: 3-deoxy-D-manno-octulosonic acid kinase, partial [Verrucomicrobiae bacterium]|nr:3-deoxy-D-manno-octulosonic acid kinase [Verrucomicrobiae bacterium]